MPLLCWPKTENEEAAKAIKIKPRVSAIERCLFTPNLHIERIAGHASRLLKYPSAKSVATAQVTGLVSLGFHLIRRREN
ncbi:MAG TPA: hypothetical protein VKA60_18500 [Blastocatellia bacterium]|nr:hypothetical protein [Blastocatellia bacterium]